VLVKITTIAAINSEPMATRIGSSMKTTIRRTATPASTNTLSAKTNASSVAL